MSIAISNRSASNKQPSMHIIPQLAVVVIVWVCQMNVDNNDGLLRAPRSDEALYNTHTHSLSLSQIHTPLHAKCTKMAFWSLASRNEIFQLHSSCMWLDLRM
jgi:hypothetical protein